MESDPASATSESGTGLSTLPVDARHRHTFKVLLVEDEVGLCLLLRLAFAHEPYRIYEAATGEMALTLCLALAPDLILLDITLPDMNGIRVLQQIRQVNQTVRILMVSARNARQWSPIALAHGANGFVAKPFNLVTLRTVVRQQLNEAREEG